MAKIKGPFEARFCSKTNRLQEIFKKPFFSNFAFLTHHEGLKIGMDHLFVPNYQINMEIAKSVWTQKHFYFTPYLRASVNMAHPALAQNHSKCIQKII